MRAKPYRIYAVTPSGTGLLTLLATASEAQLREKAEAYLKRGARCVRVMAGEEHLFTLEERG